MSDDRTYRFLKWGAILSVVFVLGWMAIDYYRAFGPGDVAYIDGNSLFKDGDYERAVEYYLRAIEESPEHVGAWHSLANAYVQLKDYDRALTAIERAIQLKPDFGGLYAIRGIIYDHMGKYRRAIADYEKSLRMDPKVSDGMHWLDRLLYNVQERPPTVKDRMLYLKAQFRLPPEKRVLRKPEVDEAQRPYEQ